MEVNENKVKDGKKKLTNAWQTVLMENKGVEAVSPDELGVVEDEDDGKDFKEAKDLDVVDRTAGDVQEVKDLRGLYDTLSRDYDDVGSYDDFRRALRYKENLEKVMKAISEAGLPIEEVNFHFSRAAGGGKGLKETAGGGKGLKGSKGLNGAGVAAGGSKGLNGAGVAAGGSKGLNGAGVAAGGSKGLNGAGGASSSQAGSQRSLADGNRLKGGLMDESGFYGYGASQYVPEAENVKMVTPSAEMLKRWPFLNAGEVVPVNTDTGEPIWHYEDRDGRFLTPTEAAKVQEDGGEVYRRASTLTIADGDGAVVTGYRGGKGTFGFADEMLRKRLGENYMNETFTIDGRSVKGSDILQETMQGTSDAFRQEMEQARKELRRGGNREKIEEGLAKQWSMLATPKEIHRWLDDEKTMEQSRRIADQEDLNNAELVRRRGNELMKKGIDRTVQKELDSPWWQQLGRNLTSSTHMRDAGFASDAGMARLNDEGYRQGQAMANMSAKIDRYVKERQAEDDEHDNFLRQAGRGFADTMADRSTWDDWGSAADALTVKKAVEAVQNGTATREERIIADVAALAKKAESSVDNLGYTAGSVTAQTVKFMAEIMATPGAGIGKTTQRIVGRGLYKILGKAAANGLSKAVARGGAIAGRIAGDALFAGFTTALYGQGRIMADMTERLTGNVEGTVDERGLARFTGTSDAETNPLTALRKAATAQWLENVSELWGEYLRPLTGLAGRLAGKGLKKMGLDGLVSGLARMDGRMRNTLIARMVKRMHYDGVWGEYAEEVMNNVANAALVGDMDWTTGERGVWNPKTNYETFVSVALMSAVMGTAQGLSYAVVRGKIERDYARSERDCLELLGSMRWTKIKDRLDDAEDKDFVETVRDVTKGMTKEERAAVVVYGTALYAKKGSDIVGLGDLVDEQREESAGGLQADEGKGHKDSKDLNESSETGGSDVQGGSLPSEEEDPNLNEADGLLHPVTLLKDANGRGRTVYVTSGTVAVRPDGGVDIANSSETLTVRDPVTGEVKMITPNAIAEVGAVGSEAVDVSQHRSLPSVEVGDVVETGDGRRATVMNEADADGNVLLTFEDGHTEMAPADGVAVVEGETADDGKGLKESKDLDESSETGGGDVPGGSLPSEGDKDLRGSKELDESSETGGAAASSQTGGQLSEAMPLDDAGEPMFGKVDPERAYRYLYEGESGWSAEVADEFVKNKETAAKKKVEALKKKVPKVGTSVAKYNNQMAEWKAKLSAAEQEADYWGRVRSHRAKAVGEVHRQAAEAQALATERALEEERKRKEAEAAAREERERVGRGNAMPSIVKRWEEAPKVDGMADEMVLADGSRVKGHYVLTESGAASASHDVRNGFRKTEGFPEDANGGTVNDRDYERDKDAQRVTRSIAEKYDSRALQTPVVVSVDGVVLSGNGRTMAGELAAMNGTDGAYVEYLRDHAGKYGFSREQVEGMEHPRVLFVPDEAMPYSAETFARFNRQEMKSQSKTETAVKLGKVVDDATFGRLLKLINGFDSLAEFYSDAKAAKEAVRELVAAGVVGEEQIAELFDGDGLSAQGRELLENTLIGKAFANMPDAVRMLTEYKQMRQSVVSALGEIVNNGALGGDYSLLDELSEAVALCYKSRKAGIKVGDRASVFARQGNLFALDDGATVADYTNATIMMLADVLNDVRVSQLKKVLSVYNRQALDSANGQIDMFSGTVRSREDILKDVLQILRKDENGKEGQGVSKDGVGSRSGEGSRVGGGTVEQDSLPKKEDGEEVEDRYGKPIAPQEMSQEEKKKRGDMLRDAEAIDVEEGVIVAKEGVSARKSAEEWWNEHEPEPIVYDTEIGAVTIDLRSIGSSLAHRYGQAKLDAITSLSDGFENAVYLGTLPDSRERGVVDHYFAYPIKYKGKRCYVFCRVMKDANKNRLYVHEVFVGDKIKKGNTLQTAAFKPHGGISLYRDILANVLSSVTGVSEQQPNTGVDTVSGGKDNAKTSVVQGNGGKVLGEKAKSKVSKVVKGLNEAGGASSGESKVVKGSKELNETVVSSSQTGSQQSLSGEKKQNRLEEDARRAVDEYVKGMPSLQAGRVRKILGERVKYSDGIRLRGENIMKLVSEGCVFSVETWNGKKEYSYTTPSGESYIMSKTELDFALFLDGKQADTSAQRRQERISTLMRKYHYPEKKKLPLLIARSEREAKAFNDKDAASRAKELQELLDLMNARDEEREKEEKGKATLTDKQGNLVDEHGYPFIKTSKGAIDFGELKKETGLTPAPIRLSEGFQNSEGKGYGLKHIESRHGEQIRKAGFNSVIDFVENVAQNFTTIRKGNKRLDDSTFLLEVKDKHNNTLFIELSKDGNYWNVNSGGIFHERYSKKKEVVWTLPTVGSSTNADATGVNHGNYKGATVTSGNSPQTTYSEGKDNAKTLTEQESGGKVGEKGVSLEAWKAMDAEARLAEAAKLPLTEKEIDGATTDEVNKANALDYVRGNHGFIQGISYLKVYEDVRYSNGSVAVDSGTENSSQLDGTDNGGRDGLGTGRESGNGVEQLDRGEGKAALSGRRLGGQSGTGGLSADSGTQGDSVIREERQPMGGRSAGGGKRQRGGITGRQGGDGRQGNGSKGGGVTGGTGSRENNSGRGDVGGAAQVNGTGADAFLSSALDDFNSVLDEFKKAGKKDLSVSLVGMNARQLELLPRLISAGAKVGYAYIKRGVYDFGRWLDAMREKIGGALASAGMSDGEVDSFITEMWRSKLPIDGEVHTLEEWASILGGEPLRRKVAMTLEEKRRAQRAAEPIAVKVGDRENIGVTLPFLLPQQQDDVARAEKQFFDEAHNDRDHAWGKGYMFTNGTGTGKTYTGLGIVKRFIKQGKGRILILTPSQPKVSDWIKDGANLGIDLRDLDSWAKERGTTATTEKGDGAVITTFANFRQNEALLEDDFDLIVYDESHRLLENKRGAGTSGAMQHYMLSNRNEDMAFVRLQKVNPVYLRMKEILTTFDKERKNYISVHAKGLSDAEIYQRVRSGALPPDINGDWDVELKRRFADLAALRDTYYELNGRYEDEVKPVLQEHAKAAAKRTKVVFLSATPFNTRENLEYAEGYIFMYPESDDGRYGQSGRAKFYLTTFGAGYKYRYHRLESSVSNAEALAKQEVEFSDYLQNTLGTMSGRIIDSDFDYSRDFPTVTMDKASELNAAMDELSKNKATAHAYYKVMGDYLYSSALFETLKVNQVIPRIKEHLAMGRKVVVFHRRVESKTPLQDPLSLIFETAESMAQSVERGEEREALLVEIGALKRKYANLTRWMKGLDYRMPRVQLADAFGQDNVSYFSGKETTKEKNAAVKTFNDDNSGKDLIVIQESSGKEGISLHDTTGVHQRVLITLALPQSPITALQIEGRIYRIGNKSNAIFEYPLLGLNSELILFGQKFNQQVSTTENLALGSQARNLRESFARGVEEHSGDVQLDEQGVGGKEFDAPVDNEKDGFDRAVLDYYTNQKLNGRRDNREGKDYYPTPEPLGYVMVKWGGLTDGESVLEPSAGHGAIARYVPRENPLTAIEPSQELFGRLQLKVGGTGRRFENDVFESYNVVNKHDVVVMNPPFGVGGRLAVDHLAKAFSHLEEGGRIVAIIPRGSTDAKFDKWYEGEKNAVMTGEVQLPDITFERAGTKVRCRVVVIDKVSNKTLRSEAAAKALHVDLSGSYDKIEDFFEDLRDVQMPGRTIDTKAKLRKKALPVARDIRGIKGTKEVSLDEDGIYVRGSHLVDHVYWGDKQGTDLIDAMAESYKQSTDREEFAHKRGWEYGEAVMGELKALACKLAGMTEDEMQRYVESRGSALAVSTREENSADTLGSGPLLSTVVSDVNTATGGTIYKTKIEKYVGRNEYVRIANVAKEHGGYYSRVKKAFVFNDENDAKAFVAAVNGETGASDDVRFRLGDDAESFEDRQRVAVANRGTVMPGLNEASVEVVEAEPNTFANFAEARRWAKEHIERAYDNEETGGKGEISISHRSVNKFLSESAVKKSTDKDVHMAVLKVLPDVIRTSIEAEEHPDYSKEDSVRNLKNGINERVLIHRLFGAISYGGNIYRVKVTVKEFMDKNAIAAPHSYEATKIELLEGTLADVKYETYPRTSNSNGVGSAHNKLLPCPLAKLLKGVEKSYDKGKKLLAESEKSDVEAGNVRSLGALGSLTSGRGAASLQQNSFEDVSSDEDVLYRLRTGEAPRKTGIGYKVFVLKDGKLYPPMVANPGGEATPVGVWLDADAAPVVGQTKTGRNQVKAGGKGTQGGSGKLAYRPGWHLGVIPYALQFRRVNPETGEKELFPNNFVWAEVEYADDVDYQKEAYEAGVNKNGKYVHSLAGLPYLPVDGSYKYRTNPDPKTDPWIITGAMKVKRLLTPSEVDEMVEAAGRKPQQRQKGAVTDAEIDALNEKLYEGANGSKSINEGVSSLQHRSMRSLLPSRLLDKVTFLEDNSGLRGRKRAAKGWYDVKTGKIVVVLGNHRDEADVLRTLLHEGVAHMGLRELFGKDFDAFLDNVFANVTEDVRRKILDLSKRHGWNIRVATEEYLASLAEDENFEAAKKSGLWQQVKAWFVDMLRKVGVQLPVELTDNDLRYILWRSYENLQEPLDGGGVVAAAKDVAMREDLGVSSSAGLQGGSQRLLEDVGSLGALRSLKDDRFRDDEAFSDEELRIINMAKDAGTYMKAPNGKPTKLTEKQWVQVRTAAFKKWFGDWEKVSRIEKLKRSAPVHITGKEIEPSEDLKEYKKNAFNYGKKLQGEYTNNDTGDKVYLQRGRKNGGINEVLQHDYKDVEHLQSIAAIPQIIENSIYIDSSANQDKEKNPSVKEYQYYVCGLKIGDTDYTVRSVIAVDNNGLRYYDHKLTNIEKGKLLDQINDQAVNNGFDSTSGTKPTTDNVVGKDSKLFSIAPTIQKAGIEDNTSLSGYKDKRLFSILQTNSSKVVDENGEPLVVYHGTSLSREQEQNKETFYIDEDWTIKRPKAPFTIFKGGEYGGLIFTSISEDKAADIGRTRSEHLPDDERGNEQWTSESYVYELFANAKRPFNVKVDKAVKSVLDEVGDGLAVYDFYTGIESKISRDEAENVLKGDNSWQVVETSAFQNVLRKHGYDSIIAKDEGVEYVAVYHPNQLKAAGSYLTSLSNNGRFSIEDPDIRFRDGEDLDRSWREEYDAIVGTSGFKFSEAWGDYMASMKELQELVAKASGKKVAEFEDVWTKENHLSSKNKAEAEYYGKNFYEPVVKAVKALVKAGARYNDKGKDIVNAENDILRYMIAKHGLERNALMRERAKERLIEKKMGDSRPEKPAEDADAATLQAYAEELAAWEAEVEEQLGDKLAEIDKRDYSGLSELFPQEDATDETSFEEKAEAYVETFEGRFDTSDLWKAVNAATKETLKKAFVSGLMDRPSYEQVREMYKYYIPLRGWETDVADEHYLYGEDAGGNGGGSILKRAKGRTSLANNPLAVMGEMATRAISQGNKNTVKQALYSLAANHHTPLLSVSRGWYVNVGTEEDPEWELQYAEVPEGASAEAAQQAIEAFEAKMAELKAEGRAKLKRDRMDLGYHATKEQQAQHMVTMMIGGRHYAVWVNANPRAAQALNGLLTKREDGRSLLRGMMRWMSKAMTSLNPQFTVRNYERDAMLAASFIMAGEPSDYRGSWLREMGRYSPLSVAGGLRVRRLIVDAMAGKRGAKGSEIELMREFLLNGGETGYTERLRAEDFKRKLRREIGRKNGLLKTKQAAEAVGYAVEQMNRVFEDATRFATFVASRRAGRSIQRSVRDAKEVSLNFNRRGADGLEGDTAMYWLARNVRKWYIFANPAIQGLGKNWRMIATTKLKGVTWLAAVPLLVGLTNCLLGGVGGGDDDKGYEALPDWIRRTNICIPIGGGMVITIPLSYEQRVAYGLGVMIGENMKGQTEVKDVAMETASMLSDLSPVSMGSGSVAHNLAPSVFAPIVDVLQNEDYLGRPIWRDGFNELAPEWTKAYAGTPGWLTKSAEVMNSVTGGGDVGRVRRGLVNWNPALVNHLMRNYFGAAYSLPLQQGANAVEAIWNPEKREVRNIPVVSGNLYDTTNSGARMKKNEVKARYHKYMEEYKTTKALWDGYRGGAKRGALPYARAINELVESGAFERMQIIDAYTKGTGVLDSEVRAHEYFPGYGSDEAAERAAETSARLKEQMVEKLDEVK